MKRVPVVAGVVLYLSLIASHAVAQAPVPVSVEPPIDAVRAATEKYRDVQVALAEGYIRDPMDLCVTSAMEGQPSQLGAMGIHYFRPDLLGITAIAPRVDGTGTHTDFLTPAVLIYEPAADGAVELVAVENLVFRKAWKEAGNTAPPAFHGHEYYPMVDNPFTELDEAHGFEPHYELHLWLYRDNPAGPFMPFNARASCLNHTGAGDHGGHAPAAPHVMEGHALIGPGEIEWQDAPAVSPGAKVAFLEGGPTEPAPFTMRIRLPADSWIGLHVHPTTERVTVLSGTFHLGIGASFDRAGARALGAGSVAIMPPGMPMFAFTEEETEIQIHGIGPWGIRYLEPDAPSPRQ